MAHEGWTLATTFKSSGRSRLLSSLVALQVVKMCSIESTGQRQRVQAELWLGWFMEILSLVRKSEVKNFRCNLSFLAS